MLSDISEHCFERDVFKSEGAKRVIRYAREKYGDELEYLWEKFPTNAVLRRKDNAKWYAALIVLPKSKLGMDDDGVTDILDLRMDTDRGDVAVDGRRYFPAYHMNKKTWFTVCLDGSVSLEEVFRRIDASYDLAGKKK